MTYKDNRSGMSNGRTKWQRNTEKRSVKVSSESLVMWLRKIKIRTKMIHTTMDTSRKTGCQMTTMKPGTKKKWGRNRKKACWVIRTDRDSGEVDVEEASDEVVSEVAVLVVEIDIKVDHEKKGVGIAVDQVTEARVVVEASAEDLEEVPEEVRGRSKEDLEGEDDFVGIPVDREVGEEEVLEDRLTKP